MAGNVYGEPITDVTLRKMPQYAFEKVITRKHRATVALERKNQNGNDLKIHKYVEDVAKRSGSQIVTKCVIYNATGDTISYVGHHDWYDGRLADSSPYPFSIANGQWGGFVHVKPPRTNAGSHGAVVYRGKNQTNSACGQAGNECDWMVCWENPYNVKSYKNTVYTEIRGKNHFVPTRWEVVKKLKEASKKQVNRDEWGGCVSNASTSVGNKAIMEAVFTLVLT